MDVFYQHSCFANYDEACHVLSVDEAGKVIMINKNITETLACESLTDNVTEDITENENNTLETQDIDEELISIVQQRPALYDHRIPLQERTKLKKKDLWQEVSN
ncbi:unnamed protein product [Lasius platythorax]|uniref:Uncharacterized protein n=1 Tax=Lasius platythorax TaxID=488582 RepID=A0AAV2P7L9_9HYME